MDAPDDHRLETTSKSYAPDIHRLETSSGPKVLKSIRALERRRTLLTIYAIQERTEDVLRIINSKHLKRRKLNAVGIDAIAFNKLHLSETRSLNPSDRSVALNERSSSGPKVLNAVGIGTSRDIYNGKDIIAFRLLDYDSNGEERIYSLDGWD